VNDPAREQRAVLAQQLRENRLLRNVLDEQAADCIEAWRTGATAAIREDAWHAMRAISWAEPASASNTFRFGTL